MEKIKKISEDEEAANYICWSCAKERGYHWPKEGTVHDKMGRCDYCDSRTIVFDREDLVPSWEE